MTSRLLNIGLSFGASLVVGLVALWTLEALQLKYALAFTLSLIVLALMNLYAPYGKSFSLTLTRGNIGAKILWLSWLSAILLLISIESLETSSQFLAWNKIPILTWLRIIASFSLTTIYPGYGLTTLILRERNLQLLEKTVFSILLSMFISSTIAFVGILVDGSVGALSLIILLFVNILLLILTSYLARHDLFSKARAHHVVNVKLTDITRTLLLSALIVFILLSVYSVSFPDKFVPTIDQWYHYGNILRALNGTLFSFVPGFYWLYMYAGLFIYGAGAPFINAYMTLFILCPLPILCFYLMCSRFWSKNKALLATTVYALFSGFGGIYANYLRLAEAKDIISAINFAASKTCDISVGAVSFSFYLFPKLIGFSALFTLIYLIYDSKLPKLGRSIFISAIFALGYLTHVAEMYVFLIVTTFLLLFSKKHIPDPKSLPYGLVSGLIIIAIVDLLAPQKKYLFPYFWTGYIAPAALGLLGMGIFLCILSRLRLNLSSIGELTTKAAKKLSLPIVIVFIYLLTLSVTIWAFLCSAFCIGYTGGTFVWYLYSIRFGIATFLAVFGAYQLFRNGEFKMLKLSLIILLISVSLERVLSYVITENLMLFAFLSPLRMVEFAWVGVAMLAAPALVSILKRTADTYDTKRELNRIPKKFAATVLLVMIIIAGSSSALYNVQIRSTPSITLTGSELEALDFLQNNTPSNVTILALGYSANKINDFGGRFPMRYYQPAVFGANTFEAIFDMMKHNTYELYGHFPIKYFWLANSDLNELKKYEKGYFAGYLLNYLPVVYKNDEVTIFEIPSFSPPSQHSDLVIITAPLQASEQENILESLALANLNYSIKSDFGSFTSTNSIQILPSDPHLHAQNTSPYTIPEDYTSQETTIVFNSLAVKSQPLFNGLGPTVHETLSNAFLRTNYQYCSPENIIFYLDLKGSTKYNVTSYSPSWRFLNITSNGEIINPSAPEVNSFTYLYGVSPDRMYRVYWTMNGVYQPFGWKEDSFLQGWHIADPSCPNGIVNVISDGDIIEIVFNATSKYNNDFTIQIPSVNVSKYRYLLLKEKIELNSYQLGYLRLSIDGYTYRVRGWISETKPPGHPWKTYIFDLYEAVPEREDAPVPPKGLITAIWWYGGSVDEKDGIGKLSLDYVMLANQTLILPATITTLNDFEDGNEHRIVYSNNFSKKLSRGEAYSLLENADYLGIALYGSGYINGERSNHDYWQYYWVKGNTLNVTSNGDCYIDKVVKVRIEPMLEDRVLDGIENPVLSKLEEPFGVFATLLSLDVSPTKQKKIVNGVTGLSEDVTFPSIEVPLFYSNDAEVTPIAFYVKDGDPVSPYAFSKKIGDYEIIYVEAYPYLEALQQRAGADEGIELFMKLGELINVLGLSLPKYQPPSEPIGRAILYGPASSAGNVTVHTDSFYIPALDSQLLQAVGWKEDVFQSGWSMSTNMPESGNMIASPGDVLAITFNASAKNVWQYFKLNVPNINVSQYSYLIFKEKTNASSYNLGYLRIIIGGYTYCVRGWTSETKPPGHPWKTYVFDLSDSVPQESEAPTPPKGPITQILWTGVSTGEKGGMAKLYLDCMLLTSSPMTPMNYGEITASLDLSDSNSTFLNGIPTTEKTFANMKVLDMQISGDFNSTFTSTEATLMPPGLRGYSKIAFNKECNLTLWLANDSQTSFTMFTDGKQLNVTVRGGKIHLNLTPLKGELVAYMSDARVSVDGYTKFEKAFISWPYGIYDPELPMEVNGPVRFKVNVMDQDFSLISELEVDGTYEVFTEQQVKWNEWDIPWLTVLTSPYHIILVAGIVTGLVIHNLRKKRKIKASFKLR